MERLIRPLLLLLRRCGSSRGSSALEFMLILPTLLLVLAGMLTLANFLTTRYFLTAAASHAARSCVLQQTRNGACVSREVTSYLPALIRGRCAGGVQFNAAVSPLPGTSVQVFNVGLRCSYSADIGARLLTDAGIVLPIIEVKGAMAFSQ